MSHVELNEANKKRCRCPGCPVQGESACSMKKMEDLKQNKDLPPKELPKVYCSIGRATCKDLDGKKGCLCPSCLVWEENDLSNNHYCLKGEADKIN